MNNRSEEDLVSKEYEKITDVNGMASTQEIQLMIKAASFSGGLSRDAIHSIGSLASSAVRPQRCLEDLLEELDPKDQGGLDKLRRIKNAAKGSSYLD